MTQSAESLAVRPIRAWTVSKGLVRASKVDVDRADAINAMMEQPLPILPRAEGDPVLPFAIGLWDEILRRAKPDVSRTVLRRATGTYLHRKSYLFASAQPDAMRHDIDGTPVEPVSPEDRYRAQLAFLALREKFAQSASLSDPAKAV